MLNCASFGERLFEKICEGFDERPCGMALRRLVRGFVRGFLRGVVRGFPEAHGWGCVDHVRPLRRESILMRRSREAFARECVGMRRSCATFARKRFLVDLFHEI